MGEQTPVIYHLSPLPDEELLRQFGTTVAAGLSSAVAANRLATCGYNKIAAGEVAWQDILLRQFKSAFIYLLLSAAAIVFAIGEHLDAGILLLFVAINAALGFFQAFRRFITPRLKKVRD